MTWDNFSMAVNAVMVTLALAIFLLPVAVANFRRVSARRWILLVNLALGITGIGWIVALVWAFKAPSETEGAARPAWPIVAVVGSAALYLPAVLYWTAGADDGGVNLSWLLFPIFQVMLLVGSIVATSGQDLVTRARTTALCAGATLAAGLAGGGLVEVARLLLVPDLRQDASSLTLASLGCSLLPSVMAFQLFWRRQNAKGADVRPRPQGCQ